MHMQVFGEEKSKVMESEKVIINIHTQNGDSKTLHLYSSNQIIPDLNPPDISAFKKSYPQFNHLYLADDGLQHHTDILIGLDYIIDILNWKKIDATPTATLLDTVFGWVLAIRHPGSGKVGTHCLISKTLSDPLSQLWSLDTIGIREDLNNENEEPAIKQFQDSIQFKDGRYHVALPWRFYPPNLPENYDLAIGQLNSLYKSLKQGNLLTTYDEVIKNQLANGVIEVAPKNSSSEITHYLPHHAVLTPEKSTTLRIVYNGSARTKQSKTSLNDCLLKGKNLIENSAGIIIRIRCEIIGITSDIEKAYLQVGLQIRDRDATRFVWLKDINLPPTAENLIVFRFTRILFGIVASAFLLAATLKHHIQLKAHHYKHITKILKSLYVDNFANGANSLQEAIEIYNVMKKLLAEIGMNIRQWSSNSTEFMNSIPEADRNNAEIVNLLGIQWKPKADTLNIQKPSVHAPENPTKRTVLQFTAAIYDPMGFFSPIILKAKLFIQKLWILNFEWDQKLNENLTSEWRIMANSKKFPPTPYLATDASKDAYAAAVYIRATDNETSHTHLLFAKTRVTPPKNENELAKFTPKFELLGVLIGARILNFVETSLEREISEKILWTDSQCAMAWIQSPQVLPVFIEKRVNDIKQLVQNIKYVPGEQNVADIASRGGTLDEMKAVNWFNGPPWLNDEKLWPEQPVLGKNLPVLPTETSENTTTTLLTNTETETTPKSTPFNLIFEKYTTYGKLISVTEKCLIAANKFRKIQSDKTRQQAEEMWIIYFQDTIGEKITHYSHLGLKKDENNVLRCRGRLENCTYLTDEEKHPILLLPDWPITKLIVMHYHNKLYHVGTQHTLAEIRRKFWIPTGRRVVYFTLKNNCKNCKKLRNKPYRAPPTPPLPKSRLNPTKPFENSGVDILGPLYVKFAPGECKRWILIFTCLVTRAIHMEILHDLTSEDILSAFKLFFARRGTPKLLISDNAPQFKLISTVYELSWQNAIKDKNFKDFFAKNEIVWKWIPQLAPWMGGAYERLIALVKEALKLTYYRITLTDRQLQVAIAETEAILNSRPLTYFGPNLEEDIITPNLFLRGNFPHILEVNADAPTVTGKSLVDSWKKADQLLNRFWDIFYSKYIISLRERSSKLKQKRSTTPITPQVGDIVMLADDNVKRGYWKLAEIIEIEVSEDKEIRAAKVRLANGDITRRPIIKLIPMETSTTENGNADEPPIITVSNETSVDPVAVTEPLPEDFEIAEITCEIVSESDDE
ncbi:uncharacterized protein LOC135833945 [Planococcus citri]|uniref:uncharacterized protein LOC135833945 n=1 Tax=Planococcus citri TaxID=170843 RepID=UPI0031F8CB9A